jgi:hypothetical protein
MTANDTFTAEHCANTDKDAPIAGTVVTAHKSAVTDKFPGQLYFCVDEYVPQARYRDRTVSLVSPANGEPRKLFRNDIVGLLNPELLPEDVKPILLRIRQKWRTMP